MVRPLLACLSLALALSPVASVDAAPADRDLLDVSAGPATARPAAKPPARSAAQPAAQPAASAPRLEWRARVAVAIEKLQKEDPALLERLSKLAPARNVEGALYFDPAALQSPHAAPVLLRRLLQGADPAAVRCALVDALPLTGGDWQEGAAALVAIDASPAVRKQLVSVMRYAQAPHSLAGLRRGFKDEDPDVNVAAARTAGFSRDGAALYEELYSSTFDADWDLRAAALQALGMLRLPQSREVLLKGLDDEEREVRLQALLALEQLDPEGVLHLPQLEKLAKDRKSHRIARKADLLLRKRRAAEKAAGRSPKRASRPSGSIAAAP